MIYMTQTLVFVGSDMTVYFKMDILLPVPHCPQITWWLNFPSFLYQQSLLFHFFFQKLKWDLYIYFCLYCIGFAIHWHQSTTGVHEFWILNPLPSLSPYHLSGSSQCTSPKHPVSYIEPRLAICFLHDSIHVSMPFSQIIPPSPSPTESKSLFYTSVSLLLSRIQGYRYHLSKFHIYVLVYCVGVFLSGLLHSV